MNNWFGFSREHIKSFPHLLSQNERRSFVGLFILGLISLAGIFIVLDRSYAIIRPAHGGTIYEGIIGRPIKLNPLTAVSDADRDLVSLLYAGIVRADGNGNYIPELAETVDISEDGLSYTVRLKPNLAFHDGEPLTTDDVVFTVLTAQNAAIASPLRANWEGVEVEKIDSETLIYHLKRPYAPFIASLSLGILPKHIWGQLTPQQFTVSERNLASPIGAGPFEFSSIIKDNKDAISSITVTSFRSYALGRPHIKSIELSFFDTETQLAKAIDSGDITSGVVKKDSIDSLGRSHVTRKIETSVIYALFFNASRSPVLANVKVRQALDLALDRNSIIQATPAGSASLISGPLPISVESIPRDLEGSRKLLADAGWGWDEEATEWFKTSKSERQVLTFSIATSNNEELVSVANAIAKSLEELGVTVTLAFFERADLEQARLRPRDFDSLLFGQVVGIPEDPYAFWHSSQRIDPGLNIANYANPKADALEDALRSPLSTEMFNKKLIELNNLIASDYPALFLYSPNYLYAQPKEIEGNTVSRAGIRADRFANIYEWYIEKERVWSFLVHKG